VAVVDSSAQTAVPLVSVVVCTAGRRAEGLSRLLASLHLVIDSNFEVIVVDNGPTPSAAADPMTVGCRVVHEPRRGLDRARNRGIREARGDIVAFIDDDCEADTKWLHGLRAAFADGEVGCVTGRVRPARVELPTERWFESWFSFDRGPLPRRFSTDAPDTSPAFVGCVGTGCNMAFRRAVLVELGGFDEAIEVGTLVGGGGDLDMFARVLDTGCSLVYTPDALVIHHHRTMLGALRRQFWGYGVAFGAVITKRMLTSPHQRTAVVRHTAWRLRHEHGRRLRARLRGEEGVPISLVAVDAAGILAGPLVLALAVASERLHRSRRR
jgi:glycosyltransferase involved in cell wall biosynthesis